MQLANPPPTQMRTFLEDIKTMNGYPHFQLYTWIEDTQTWATEEGRSKQLQRIPESVRSDLKRGKCRVFSDLNGNDCYAKVEAVPIEAGRESFCLPKNPTNREQP
jgi:hypothetical protein